MHSVTTSSTGKNENLPDTSLSTTRLDEPVDGHKITNSEKVLKPWEKKNYPLIRGTTS